MGANDLGTGLPNIGRRRESRLYVQLEARLILVDGTVASALADLSRNGARIVLPGQRVRPGQNAVLRWDRFERFGTVIWSNGTQLGLAFDQPVSDRILAATRVLEDARTMPIARKQVHDAARAFVQGSRRV